MPPFWPHASHRLVATTPATPGHEIIATPCSADKSWSTGPELQMRRVATYVLNAPKAPCEAAHTPGGATHGFGEAARGPGGTVHGVQRNRPWARRNHPWGWRSNPRGNRAVHGVGGAVFRVGRAAHGVRGSANWLGGAAHGVRRGALEPRGHMWACKRRRTHQNEPRLPPSFFPDARKRDGASPSGEGTIAPRTQARQHVQERIPCLPPGGTASQPEVPPSPNPRLGPRRSGSRPLLRIGAHTKPRRSLLDRAPPPAEN